MRRPLRPCPRRPRDADGDVARSTRLWEDLLPHLRSGTDEELEAADLVVCNPTTEPRFFTDDISTTCADCGTAIYHRPSMPKRPKKVCISCAVRRSKDKGVSGA